MTKIANADSARTSTTNEEVLEMLNVDVLPFFDEYDEETFSFTEKVRAVAVVAETENSFVVSTNDGKELEISKTYFQFPGTEKEKVIQHLQGTIS